MIEPVGYTIPLSFKSRAGFIVKERVWLIATRLSLSIREGEEKIAALS